MNEAERVKKVRKLFNMNQTQFAEVLCVSSATISQMESGKISVSRRNAKLLEEKFGVNPVWLLYGTGEMFNRTDVFTESVLSKLQQVSGTAYAPGKNADTTVKDIGQILEMIEQKDQLKKEASDRLIRIRTAFGLNQSQLAQQLGYTRAYISAVEKGLQPPSRRMAEMIEQQLGISANWLLYGIPDNASCA